MSYMSFNIKINDLLNNFNNNNNNKNNNYNLHKNNKIYIYIKNVLKKYKIYQYQINCKENELCGESGEIYIYDIICTTLLLMIDFLNDNILQFIYCDLYEEIFNYAYEILYIQYLETEIIQKCFNLYFESSEKLLFNIVHISRLLVFKFIVPKRSYSQTFIRRDILNNHFYC